MDFCHRGTIGQGSLKNCYLQGQRKHNHAAERKNMGEVLIGTVHTVSWNQAISWSKLLCRKSVLPNIQVQSDHEQHYAGVHDLGNMPSWNETPKSSWYQSYADQQGTAGLTESARDLRHMASRNSKRLDDRYLECLKSGLGSDCNPRSSNKALSTRAPPLEGITGSSNLPAGLV